jgi:hypothetical protein
MPILLDRIPDFLVFEVAFNILYQLEYLVSLEGIHTSMQTKYYPIWSSEYLDWILIPQVIWVHISQLHHISTPKQDKLSLIRCISTFSKRAVGDKLLNAGGLIIHILNTSHR